MGVITLIHIVAAVVVVVVVVQMVDHDTNFYFPCRPGGVCVIGGEQQPVTFDGWRGYLPIPCPYIAGFFTSDENPECKVMQQSHHQTPNAV